jgi:hypothetical protein
MSGDGEETGSSKAIDVRTYRLDPAAFEPTAKGRIRRRFAWVIPLFLGLLTLELGLLARAQPGTSDTLPVVVPIVVVAIGYGWFRAVRTQMKEGRAAWDSYQLTVGPNVLRRFIVNLPPAEMVRTEVTRIVESDAEGLNVATADRHRFVFVPRQLVGFHEVRAHLSGWKAIEPAKPGRQAALGFLWSAVLLGCWIGTGVIPDIRLAMLSGAVLLAAVGFVIREILAQRVVANERKAAVVGGLFLFMLAPVARLVLHFVYGVDPRWSP